MSNVERVASSLLGEGKKKGFFKRSLHKFRKSMLKPVVGVVVNDYHRNMLQLEFDEEEFQVIDLERLYHAVLPPSEIGKLENLKKECIRSWLSVVKEDMKKLLDKNRLLAKDEQIVCLLSNFELAKELNIKKLHVFIMDDDLKKEVHGHVDAKTRAYLQRLNRQSKKHERKEYKSKDYLEKLINKLLVSKKK